jgi:Flp pilus assembly protein TadB
MNDQLPPKVPQFWAVAGGVALAAFALWLGPVAVAVFVLALAVTAVRLLILRSRLNRRTPAR